MTSRLIQRRTIRTIHELYSFTEMKGTCRVWLARTQSAGYGLVNYNGSQVYAHHLLWFLLYGVWPPKGFYVCHECDNPPCINASHLFLGSPWLNVQDMLQKKRPHGAKHKYGKSVRDQVKAYLTTSSESQRAVAKRFGMSQATVSEIYRGLHEDYFYPEDLR